MTGRGTARASPTSPSRTAGPGLLPTSRTTWRYRGSLTTPPCTEGVAWVILTEPLMPSAGEIDAFATIHPHNFRPVQPLGERVLRRR